MRKIMLYIACSVDGYIARKDGSVDWLDGDDSNPQADNGYEQFYDEIDTVIMGRKTYDQIVGSGEYPYGGKQGYVITSKRQEDTEDIHFTDQPIEQLIIQLKEQQGKGIWIVGGAQLLDGLMKKELIDEYVIAFIPVILGEGIPLFKKGNPEIPLTLKEQNIFNGVVQIHYKKRSGDGEWNKFNSAQQKEEEA